MGKIGEKTQALAAWADWAKCRGSKIDKIDPQSREGPVDNHPGMTTLGKMADIWADSQSLVLLFLLRIS